VIIESNPFVADNAEVVWDAEPSIKDIIKPDSFNNHQKKYDDNCKCEVNAGSGKTECKYISTDPDWVGESCTWKNELKFEDPIIDCTENDGILPTKNFIRFKVAKEIPKGEYWI